MRGGVPSLDGDLTGLANGVCNAEEQPFGSVCKGNDEGLVVGKKCKWLWYVGSGDNAT